MVVILVEAMVAEAAIPGKRQMLIKLWKNETIAGVSKIIKS